MIKTSVLYFTIGYWTWNDLYAGYAAWIGG